jgi:hypothetical protein
VFKKFVFNNRSPLWDVLLEDGSDCSFGGTSEYLREEISDYLSEIGIAYRALVFPREAQRPVKYF